MEPMVDQWPWVLMLALILVGYLLAGIGTWPVGAILLHRYRRRIAAAMRPVAGSRTAVDAAARPDTDPPDTPATIARTIEIRPAEARLDDHPLVTRAKVRAGRTQRLFVVLGLGFGLSSSITFLIINPEQRLPLRFLAYTLLAGWLVVPTVLALAPRPSRTRWLVWLGYFVITVAVAYLGDVGPSSLPVPLRSLAECLLAVGIPSIFILTTGRRSQRGAAWLVAPVLLVLGVTLAVWRLVAGYYRAGEPLDVYGWATLGLGVGMPLAGVGLIWAIVRIYRTKWLDDQTLLILQWWLVLTLWWGILTSVPRPWLAPVVALPYLILLFGLLIALTRREKSREGPVRLLLLRTFGARGRSSRLLHDVTRQWRWVGSVELISAPDLAGETLEPDEFLDFVLGRLRQRFVLDAGDLDRRLQRLDLRPDRDGRYRVNELMCSDDTWQLALERLAGDTDVILIDLRDFTQEHPGVDHEVQRLVALQSLRRVVAILDASTDEQTLRASLDRAAALAPPSAPLHSDPDPALRVIDWQNSRVDADRLLAALAGAASAPR